MPTLSCTFCLLLHLDWNEFFLPLIFLISNDNQTVPIAMALARGERGMAITTQSAAALLGRRAMYLFSSFYFREP